MLIYTFIISSIILTIVIWIGRDIYNDTKILDLPGGLFIKSFYLLMFFTFIFTIVNLGVVIWTYVSTKNKIGETGEKGIKGLKGEDGNNGICNSKCGQKLCYSDTISTLDKYISTKINNPKFKIKNKFLLNKINKICHSSEYQNILNKDNNDKPSEKKLIQYIKDTSKIWIDEIMKYPDAIKFLESPSETDNYWDLKGETTPFNEIRKYDLWNLSEPKKNTILLRKHCLKDSDLPEAEDPPLSIKYSNNYIPVYTGHKNYDEWGPRNCPYYQLGYKNKNPRNIRWCWFSRWHPHWGDKTWRLKKRTGPNKPISLYTPKVYHDKEGKKGREKYYPLGSVWNDSNNIWKNSRNKCTPKTQPGCGGKNKHHYLGPNKETLLVSGDVVKPVRFKKIWNSRDGCKSCQAPHNNVTIWEPIAPEGYTCIGDVVTKGNYPPSKDIIRCVPNKCVEKMPLGKNVWDSNGMSEKSFRSKNDENSNRNFGPVRKPELVSIFSAGHNLENNIKVNKDDYGGYNLFRANKGTRYPLSFNKNGHSYKIKEQCYIKKQTKKPILKSNNIDVLGYPDRDSKYSVDSYLKKTQLGVITQTIKNGNDNKKMYIQHSGSKNPNEYFIKAYNHTNNNFEDCYTVNDDKVNKLSECNKKNKNQLFKLSAIKDKNNKYLRDAEFNRPLVKLKSQDNLCFTHTIDNNGIGRTELKKCDGVSGRHVWGFKSVSGDIL